MTSQLLDTIPFDDGFVMPAEYEPHSAVWLILAEDLTNWYNGGFPARDAQRAIIEAITEAGTHVNLGVSAACYLIAEELFADLDVTLYELSSVDCWARDTGAIYVKNRATGAVRGVDFKFNSWGGEQRGSHGCTLDYAMDDMVARKMLQATGHDRYRTPFVLEGGSINTDGEGTVITTESCLLNPNRNPDLSREDIERTLHDYLGFEKVIWLREGVDCEEGETDGHIDDVCAFIGPAEVVCCYTDDEDNEYHDVFKDCYETLCASTDAHGRPLTVHKLTAANPFRFTKEEAERLAPAQGVASDPDGTWRCEGDFAVPSYANFLITNGSIIFPTYDLDTDDEAVACMRAIVGDRYRVIPVPAHNIALGGGSVHCITQQVVA
ncbi:agmatine deiminase family protein [Eggerthella sinensis]|uniref:agmatine deiminase family protein n=1 Tax=Eggerthella sinensis TaxID=242230 RepID=UPI00266CE522|nr:agmatine deiminase family protein [Eggerthella sinensis]